MKIALHFKCLECAAADARSVRMDDAELVKAVAQQWLHRHGEQAVDLLHEAADIAAGLDQRLSAEAWRDIAEQARSLLGER